MQQKEYMLCADIALNTSAQFSPDGLQGEGLWFSKCHRLLRASEA